MPAWNWGGAGKGAAGGAAIGSIAGPKGAAIGALGGGLIGGFAGGQQDKADQERRAALEQAIADQERARRDQAMQRERDMAAIMGFYGPAQSALGDLYGIPASAWGPGAAGNGPQSTPGKSGMLNGMPVSMPGMRPQFASLSGRRLENAPQSLPAGARLSAPKLPPFSGMGRLR